MGLKHLVSTLREEDIEQKRTTRHRGQLRQRLEREILDEPLPPESPPPDLGGRTFEDRQTAVSFSTLIGRGGLKAKGFEYSPVPSFGAGDGSFRGGLRHRASLEDRDIPGGVATRFRIRRPEPLVPGQDS